MTNQTTNKPRAWWDEYEMPPWAMGSAHYVSSEDKPDDVVDRLHDVVEEVTGKPVEKPERKRIGFL